MHSHAVALARPIGQKRRGELENSAVEQHKPRDAGIYRVYEKFKLL